MHSLDHLRIVVHGSCQGVKRSALLLFPHQVLCPLGLQLLLLLDEQVRVCVHGVLDLHRFLHLLLGVPSVSHRNHIESTLLVASDSPVVLEEAELLALPSAYPQF